MSNYNHFENPNFPFSPVDKSIVCKQFCNMILYADINLISVWIYGNSDNIQTVVPFHIHTLSEPLDDFSVYSDGSIAST